MTPEQLATARDRITRGIPYDEIAKGLGFKNVTTEAIAAIAMEMRVETVEYVVKSLDTTANAQGSIILLLEKRIAALATIVMLAFLFVVAITFMPDLIPHGAATPSGSVSP